MSYLHNQKFKVRVALLSESQYFYEVLPAFALFAKTRHEEFLEIALNISYKEGIDERKYEYDY